MRCISSAASVVLVCAWCVSGPVASAQTYSNSTSITIPTNWLDGRAAPYPSSIVVSDGPTSIDYLSVTLHGFSHEYTYQVRALLVAPGGQKVELVGHPCAGASATGVTLTFVPDGASVLPQTAAQMVSGVYACSVYGGDGPASLAAPAPGSPYDTSLMPLLGTNANGTWSLYVFDIASTANNGSVSGGWSIAFNDPQAQPTGTAFTYQSRITTGGSALSGDANIRFTLCQSGVAPLDAAKVGTPITRSFTGITNGLITAPLDFGSEIDIDRALWLNLEIESPPGSGFSTLTPRQPLTAAPRARVAQFAASATNAVNATNALNATNATNAANAQFVDWSNIGGVPSNVLNSFSPWIANGAHIGFASGRVGVGTTAPSRRLHVVESSSSIVANFDGTSTLGTWLNLSNSSAGGRYWRLISTGSGNGEGAGNLVIGHGTTDSGNAAIMTMNSSTGNVGIGTTAPSQRLTVNGNVLANNVAVPSSVRFKDHVSTMDDALESLLKLNGVRFDWKPEWAAQRPGRERDIGFVAEDVAKVFPEVVFRDEQGNVTGMDYSRLTAVAIQAIKQQNARVEDQHQKIEALRGENQALKDRLDRLEMLLRAAD